MLFNRNHIKRILAGFLLFTILFIQAVKLLHSHKKSQVSNYHNSTLSAKENVCKSSSVFYNYDCSTCVYHLTKDADSFYTEIGKGLSVWYVTYSSSKNCFIGSVPFSSFENRGPPSLI